MVKEGIGCSGEIGKRYEKAMRKKRVEKQKEMSRV